MIRWSNIFIALAVALFFTITVINNVTDFTKTLMFVKHTLSMDTTSHNPHFMWRAISNPFLQQLGYIVIILLQALVALLCWVGVVKMYRTRRVPSILFYKAKQLAISGASMGFVLYGLGFLTIAGQWFVMRESTTWNVQGSIHAFLTFIGISLLVLYLPEQDENKQLKSGK